MPMLHGKKALNADLGIGSSQLIKATIYIVSGSSDGHQHVDCPCPATTPWGLLLTNLGVSLYYSR